jgi:hypothetical protein
MESVAWAEVMSATVDYDDWVQGLKEGRNYV